MVALGLSAFYCLDFAHMAVKCLLAHKEFLPVAEFIEESQTSPSHENFAFADKKLAASKMRRIDPALSSPTLAIAPAGVCANY